MRISTFIRFKALVELMILQVVRGGGTKNSPFFSLIVVFSLSSGT